MRMTGAALLIVTLGGMAGCSNSPHAQYRLAHRRESMNDTLRVFAKGEAARPAKLAEDFRFMGRELKKEVSVFDATLQETGRLFEADVKRWNERQPQYWSEAARFLRGKPEQIERVAIDLFY